MRITVLAWLDEPGATPDTVVGQVVRALASLGHDVSVISTYDRIEALLKLRESRPDLVFNLMEMFGEDVTSDVAVAGLLDLLRVPYTGGGPGELFLAQDKALGKKLLAFEGLKYPNFAVFYADAGLETAGSLRFPLFVKPMRADASIGIDDESLVRDSASLMRAVLRIHDEVGDAALAEEFIEGRELYVGVLGNRDPIAFPPMEMHFDGDGPNILDQESKFERGSEKFRASRSKLAEIPDEMRARLQQVAIAACRALKVRDYARVDLRLTDTGDIYVLEVNANCYLEEHDEFPVAAKAADIEYRELIGRIVALAMERARIARPDLQIEQPLTDAP